MLTRETGGTPIGERLREILHDTTVTDLADRAEALITAADRAQHVAHVVRPALAAGRSVVSDRSVYSTLGYQGYGRGLDLAVLRRINDWAIDGLWPDRVVLLDAPAAVLAERIRGRDLDRFELAGDDFHERVAAGFRADGRRRPGPLDGRRRRRRPRDGRRARTRRAGRARRMTSVWDDVVGQPTAVAALGRGRRRAGPRLPVHRAVGVHQARGGAGVRRPAPHRRRRSARRDARLALRGEHPDVHEVERVGPAISADQARDIIHVTSLAPVEGARKSSCSTTSTC